MVLTLGDHPDNTAWLTGLSCHIADESGTIYERQGNSLGGKGDEHFWPNYSLDSPYFTGGTDFTLVITKADWQADRFPGGLTIQDIERRDGAGDAPGVPPLLNTQ